MSKPSAPPASDSEPLAVRLSQARRVLACFRMLRTLGLMSIVLAAIVAARAPSVQRDKQLGLCALFLALTALATQLARKRLSSRHVLQPTRIVVTKLDRERISSLLETERRSAAEDLQRLDEVLAHAEIVPSHAVSPDVVTMNSRVYFEDEISHVAREITLVYPREEDATEARVSVFSPVGSALLGLRVGQVFERARPRGYRSRFRVLAVPYQPEAAGHFHL